MQWFGGLRLGTRMLLAIAGIAAITFAVGFAGLAVEGVTGK